MAISKNDDRKVSRQSAKQMYVNRKFDKQFHSFQAFLSFHSFAKSLIHYISSGFYSMFFMILLYFSTLGFRIAIYRGGQVGKDRNLWNWDIDFLSRNKFYKHNHKNTSENIAVGPFFLIFCLFPAGKSDWKKERNSCLNFQWKKIK